MFASMPGKVLIIIDSHAICHSKEHVSAGEARLRSASTEAIRGWLWSVIIWPAICLEGQFTINGLSESRDRPRIFQTVDAVEFTFSMYLGKTQITPTPTCTNRNAFALERGATWNYVSRKETTQIASTICTRIYREASEPEAMPALWRPLRGYVFEGMNLWKRNYSRFRLVSSTVAGLRSRVGGVSLELSRLLLKIFDVPGILVNWTVVI